MVYLLRELYQFPPLSSSEDGILLHVSRMFVADGAKTELQGQDSLEVEPGWCFTRTREMFLEAIDRATLPTSFSFCLLQQHMHVV